MYGLVCLSLYAMKLAGALCILPPLQPEAPNTTSHLLEEVYPCGGDVPHDGALHEHVLHAPHTRLHGAATGHQHRVLPATNTAEYHMQGTDLVKTLRSRSDRKRGSFD